MEADLQGSVWVAVSLVGVLAGGPVLGAEDGPSRFVASFANSEADQATDGAAGPFAKGKWTGDVFGYGLANINDQQALSLSGGGVGVNYNVWEGISARGELLGTWADQGSDTDAAGAGLNLLGRWTFVRGDRWSVFAEGGGGFLQTSVSVPDGPAASNEDGTHFNFSLHSGVGTTYRLSGNVYVEAAVRYTHISNADLAGEDENPGTDAVGGYMGLMIPF